MSDSGRTQARVRHLVWVLGSLLCLGYYTWRAVRWPVRTAVGVETPLFPVADETYGEAGPLSLGLSFFEAPGGRRWAVVATRYVEILGSSIRPLSHPRSHWPPDPASPRRLSFGSPEGTWELRGSSLRQLWRHPMFAWRDDHLLGHAAGSPWQETVLDLATGEESGQAIYWAWRDESLIGIDPPGATAVPRSSGLRPGNAQWWVARVSGRRVHLASRFERWGEPLDLYAVRLAETVHVLRLAERAVPCGLSRDGKTLFFTRNLYLWRLDLRRPVTELLDEASPLDR